MMVAGDVISICDAVEEAGIEMWLCGGWGVDALLTEQTRPHDDLDVAIGIDHLPRLVVVLAQKGFTKLIPWPDSPEGFVLGDPDDRRVDIHPLRFDAEGNGIQRIQHGEWIWPAEGFSGSGAIAGRVVRCITAEVEILCHAGYGLEDDDIHDMRMLHERLGVDLLPAQRKAIDARNC